MKKTTIQMVLAVLIVLLFVSWDKKKDFTEPVLRDKVSLQAISGHYTLEDDREFGKWCLYFDRSINV